MVGAILGTVAQVGSSIYGAIKSSQANKRSQQLIQNQRDENQKWYEQKMSADYTQRTDAQNVLRKQRELLGEQYKRARATNVVAGGSDESLALQQAEANKAMGDTMAGIAANAASYKEGIEQQYRANDAALNQQQAQTEANQANAIAQAAGQVGGAVSGLVSGGMSKKDTSVPSSALALDPDAVANEILADIEMDKINQVDA